MNVVREWVCRQVGHDLELLPPPQVNVGICASCGVLQICAIGHPFRVVRGQEITEGFPVERNGPFLHIPRLNYAVGRP